MTPEQGNFRPAGIHGEVPLGVDRGTIDRKSSNEAIFSHSPLTAALSKTVAKAGVTTVDSGPLPPARSVGKQPPLSSWNRSLATFHVPADVGPNGKNTSGCFRGHSVRGM